MPTDTQEVPIPQLSILQTPRMQTRTPIRKDTLHLRHQQISLREERPDVKLIHRSPFPQYPTRQVNARKRQRSHKRRSDIDTPALRLDLDDAANDEVADFGGVPCTDGGDGEEFVGFLDGAGDGGADEGAAGGGECTVASAVIVNRKKRNDLWECLTSSTADRL